MRSEMITTSLDMKPGDAMMRKFSLRVAVAALLGMVVVLPAQAALIDNFDNGNGSVSAVAAGADTDTSGVFAGIIGGTRKLDIPGANAVAGVGSLSMAANPGASGVLTFSLDALTTGSAKLTWDAAGAGLGSADLTDAGASTFISFDIISIDQGSVDLVVTVEDESAVVGTRLLSGAGVGNQQFTFASFTGSPDFADVKSIMLEIRGLDPASDLVLDQIFSSGEITGVPEPSTYVLGFIGFVGMAGLAVIRRRRRVA